MKLKFRTYLVAWVIAWAKGIDCLMAIITFGLIIQTSAYGVVDRAARYRFYQADKRRKDKPKESVKEQTMKKRVKRYLKYYVCAWARLIDCIMIFVTFGLVTLTSAHGAVYQAAWSRFYDSENRRPNSAR